MPEREGTLVAGRYRVMGVVWRATDDELHTLTPCWKRNQALLDAVVSAFRVGHPA